MASLEISSWLSLVLCIPTLIVWLVLIKKRKSDSESILEWLSTNWILVLFICQLAISLIQPVFGLCSSSETQNDKIFVVSNLIFGDLGSLYLAFSVLSVEIFRFTVFWLVPDDRIFKVSPNILKLTFLLQVAISLAFVWGLSDEASRIIQSTDNVVLKELPSMQRRVSVTLFFVYHVILSLSFYSMFFYNVYRIKSDLLKFDQRDSKSGMGDKSVRSETDIMVPLQMYFQSRSTYVAGSIVANIIACIVTMALYPSSPEWTIFTTRISICLCQFYIYQVTKLAMQMTRIQSVKQ